MAVLDETPSSSRDDDVATDFDVVV
ncbi:MAG: hypothetical protein V7636_2817, partial [Actinomycetota bacterium]